MSRKKLKLNFDATPAEELPPVEDEAPLSESQEDDCTFPFAKTISNLLYVYGDQKKTKVQDLAHLQIQELIEQIFHPSIMDALLNKPRNPWSEPEEFIFIGSARHKKILQQYLFAVFTEFVGPYQRLSKKLVKVEKSVSQNEDVYEQALQKKSLQENIQFDEEQVSQSEPISEQDYQETPQPEWEQYMKRRIEQMTRREFIRFMDLRSKTFISNKLFKSFFDIHNYGSAFQESINQKFLNYSLCKILKKMVQSAIKDDAAFTALGEEIIKKIGYQIINKFILRAKKYALQNRKIEQIAYNIFEKEFITQGFDAYFRVKLKITKNNLQVSESELSPKHEWASMGQLKQKWIERVRGEKQLRQILVKNKEVKRLPYTEYLLSHSSNYEQLKPRFGQLFKDWFLNYRDSVIDSIYD